ncbi:MAG: SUMF1/EgtB/PvdO family nonheme iron enzyme [Nitrospinae bacterium]|nr:SUMF1/EgtB/PvdO family nonheme iron enzyme [Nitrospinota bacterium]
MKRWTAIFLLAAFGFPPFLYAEEPGMVLVPQGNFIMGFDDENDMEWGDVDEGPVHQVYLDTYWIDLHEVSAAEYADFLNERPADSGRHIRVEADTTIETADGRFRARPGLEDYPANRATWHGADAYCRWRGKRLPTEAEWEKAARGDDGRIFPWGNRHPDPETVTYRRPFAELGFKAMEPVNGMEKGQSPYGLRHMAGNVWEWVADWFDDDYYRKSPAKNPAGPKTGLTKVLRGGNWYYKAYYMRTTYRFNDVPGATKVWQGFRCAKSP